MGKFPVILPGICLDLSGIAGELFGSFVDALRIFHCSFKLKTRVRTLVLSLVGT